MTHSLPDAPIHTLPTDFLDRARVVQLPMRTRFRGIDVREVLLVEGPAGWAEFGAFPEYAPAEASKWLASCIEMGWAGPPAALRETVEVNATIPAVQAGQVAELLDRYPGCRTVKVKVAGETSLAEDIARVEAVRAARPDMAVRCDANGNWSVAEAAEAATALTRNGPLDYLEQPCATVTELAEVRRIANRLGLPMRIAADESIRRAEDPWEVVRADAADVAVVKAAPLGGPRALVRLGSQLAEHGVALTVSSAIDSSVGMYAGLSAAAALPNCQPSGLATGSLFLEDVTEPRRLIDGHLAATDLVPDPARLDSLEAPADRRDWWFERVVACVDYLGT
ncbi:o-succinylbenzoate synthase [Corynebacterium sputi]|uniref:o-succinylbenzoate synthase n=1 Tax=Corynebacterium sputi TaxID=489915 RepID=UPI0003FAFAF1|nr:o-succinylbenzoate synthase [Corynebacterium sputi]